MSRPSAIRVLGAQYSIAQKKMRGIYGMHHFDKCLINLAPGLAHGREREVLIHELIHALDNAMQIGLSEGQVDALGVGVFSLLSDNPDLVKFLVESSDGAGT